MRPACGATIARGDASGATSTRARCASSSATRRFGSSGYHVPATAARLTCGIEPWYLRKSPVRARHAAFLWRASGAGLCEQQRARHSRNEEHTGPSHVHALTIADVERIAALAHLELTPEEKQLFTRQLADILAYAEQLQAIDTTGVPATAHVNAATRPNETTSRGRRCQSPTRWPTRLTARPTPVSSACHGSSDERRHSRTARAISGTTSPPAGVGVDVCRARARSHCRGRTPR